MNNSVTIVTLSAFIVAGAISFHPAVSMDLVAFREGKLLQQIRTSATATPSQSQTPTPTASPSSTPSPTVRPGIALVSLNFDDGYESTYQHAIPVLNMLGLKSTQYIITGKFNDPAYVTSSQVLDMEARGHEIGAHTRTHPHLTQLSEEEMQNEILGSKQDLLTIGVKEVSTFAYPYGEYNDVVAKIARSGYSTVRTTHPGFNDATSDRHALMTHSVNADTQLSDVKTWIDQAIAEKKWLILAFHRTDEDGNPISARHETLQQIGEYLIAHHVPVVTMKEGARTTFGQ